MIQLILMVFAFVLLVCAAAGVPNPPRVQLFPLGMALWALSILLVRFPQ